jgi:DNA-binding MarR family transcriptional regulator
MNPHELASLSDTELSSLFYKALLQKAIAPAQDAYTRLESRFHRLTTTAAGSQKFLDEFLALAGRREVRSLHIDDPLARCVARLEYLLELAGERARVQTEEATLRQIVASRERGDAFVQALAAAPPQGFTAGELARKLKVTQQNLSPLIRAFHIHGIIDRRQQGKTAFLKLTPQGRALFVSSPARMTNQDPVGRVLGEAVLAVVVDITERPRKFSSQKSKLGVAQHALKTVAERHREENPKAAGLVFGAAEQLKAAMGVAS